ncbi:hypothetical protein C6503_12895 [Candidatus Poribacteria bacterium]|nr:MAG: hypothetical protein C6503_12895 [Candidatus Poribacteria bacterium]
MAKSVLITDQYQGYSKIGFLVQFRAPRPGRFGFLTEPDPEKKGVKTDIFLKLNRPDTARCICLDFGG